MPNSQTQTTDLRFTPGGRRLAIGLVAALALGAPLMGPGAGSTFAQSEAATMKSALAASAKPEEHSVSQKAVEIASPFGFPITNSMAVSWIVAVALIMFARIATRDMKRVPSGAQNLLEWLVGSLYDFLERIIGPQLVKRTFWFFATVFIFILSASWMGLVPGVDTIGWGHR
ncbi:MAG TPA: F0F1 ATP synthase subunit A, partial [Vicinamibacterales bacterium]|nr:F0F1 ATP synthase subunit A [Vicinamibacterales bacterium]